MSATRRETWSGTGSLITIVLVSTGVGAGLTMMIWYSITAPGMALGNVVPLTGSDTTVASLTMVTGTVSPFVHVQFTDPAGMVIVRDSPVPENGTVVPSLTFWQAIVMV